VSRTGQRVAVYDYKGFVEPRWLYVSSVAPSCESVFWLVLWDKPFPLTLPFLRRNIDGVNVRAETMRGDCSLCPVRNDKLTDTVI